MRIQFLIFALAFTITISEKYVSGRPVPDNSDLAFRHISFLNKRAKCTREDINNERCDSRGHAIDEKSGGNEEGGNEERNGGEEKNNKGEERNKKENEVDRQAADDGSGADKASYKKNRRKDSKMSQKLETSIKTIGLSLGY